jgi:hypothetical protein
MYSYDKHDPPEVVVDLDGVLGELAAEAGALRAILGDPPLSVDVVINRIEHVVEIAACLSETAIDFKAVTVAS